MAKGGGTFVVLGTALVAVLAVAAAVGADAVAGTPDEGPAVSQTSAANTDAFCEEVGEVLAVAEASADAAGAEEASILADSADFDEAAWLNALHAQGEAQQAFIDAFVTAGERAAEIAPDPAVADAFAVSVRTGALIGTKMATLAREAESVASYLEAVSAAEADPEIVRARADGEDATAVIDAYLASTCGIFPDSDDSLVTAAKADVSTLGKEIATSFVDWDEGDPLPEVTLVGGEYYLRGVFVGTASEGAEIVDQYALSPTDWCIAVSVGDSTSATYSYSAQRGLIEGTCAALTAGA